MSAILIESETLGGGWLAIARAILERGALTTYDGHATRELRVLTVAVEHPCSNDPLIAELGDPDWLAWMHANFASHETVAELGSAQSYAARLFDYGRSGRDQIEWVVDRLRADRTCRSATITTFEPLLDTTYVPCVSMLDFWLPEGALELVVYAHSLDFGKKAYGNLVELAVLQERVAGELDAPVGRMTVHAKSAHLYEPEWVAMAEITDSVERSVSTAGS